MIQTPIRTVDADGIRYNPDLIAPRLALFDPATPELNAQPVTQGGRNAAWFIQCDGQSAVLRHYRRGGLIAKLVKKTYWWLGAERTRSWAEYAVMLHLYNNRVPVPLPLAALWQRRILGYQAAIITQRIEKAQPIAQYIEKIPPESVAIVVKQMHDAGVWHADLNVFNLLIDVQQQIYVIDFDRARRFDVVDSKHRQNNLLRLRRSLIKVRGEIGQQWYEQFRRAYLQLAKA
ncbi:MAG: 3-deoxy-D-manno-octulosonic acid kinase [Alcaligenaceae bacterium]|nr:3-deoxy-D-manno-octulosonic acid kinase [Alcaligenaceae bacterium]